jgi:hypothetical protein
MANWKQEGQKFEMDDTITAVTASKSGQYCLVNQSFSKPRIDLLQFDARQGVSHGTAV